MGIVHTYMYMYYAPCCLHSMSSMVSTQPDPPWLSSITEGEQSEPPPAPDLYFHHVAWLLAYLGYKLHTFAWKLLYAVLESLKFGTYTQ